MIRTYKLFTIVSQIRFFIPIIVIYLQNHHLSLSEISSLQAIYFFSVAILEIPTGLFADKFGRKKSIIISTFFTFLGDVLFSFGQSYFAFTLSQLFWAVGVTFVSGAAEAMFFEYLEEKKLTHSYKKYKSDLLFQSILIAAVSNLFGGYLAQININYPVFLTLPFTFLTLILSLLFKNSHENQRLNKEKINLIESIKSLLSNKKLLQLGIISSIIWGINNSLGFYYQPLFQELNISIKYFGLLFTLFYLASALGSKYYRKINLGCSSVIISFAVTCGTFIVTNILIYFYHSPFIVLMLLIKIPAIGTSKVIIADKLNHLCENKFRATFLSFFSFINSMTQSSVVYITGQYSKSHNVYQIFLLYAFLMFLILTYIFIRKAFFK